MGSAATASGYFRGKPRRTQVLPPPRPL